MLMKDRDGSAIKGNNEDDNNNLTFDISDVQQRHHHLC